MRQAVVCLLCLRQSPHTAVVLYAGEKMQSAAALNSTVKRSRWLHCSLVRVAKALRRSALSSSGTGGWMALGLQPTKNISPIRSAAAIPVGVSPRHLHGDASPTVALWRRPGWLLRFRNLESTDSALLLRHLLLHFKHLRLQALDHLRHVCVVAQGRRSRRRRR